MPRLKSKFFKAQNLRKRGASLKELSQKLGISKSTASLWSRNIILSNKAQRRLLGVISKAQLISAQKRIAKTNESRFQYENKGRELIARIKISDDILKLFCGLLYWCEGSKADDNTVQFTNSEPKLIKSFVELLRRSFILDEKKFRVSLHLHGYHSAKKQIDFWSKITKIPKKQFIKPYRKPNTGKRIKLSYQGCVNLRYNDVKVARELLGIGQAFLNKYAGLV